MRKGLWTHCLPQRKSQHLSTKFLPASLRFFLHYVFDFPTTAHLKEGLDFWKKVQLGLERQLTVQLFNDSSSKCCSKHPRGVAITLSNFQGLWRPLLASTGTCTHAYAHTYTHKNEKEKWVFERRYTQRPARECNRHGNNPLSESST